MDRVKPLKLESVDTGGDTNDEFPTSLNPEEDHVECAGIVLDDPGLIDESTVVWRDVNDMKFKDANNPSGFTLTRLAQLTASDLHAAYFDVVLNPPTDEVFGTVSGLAYAPVKVSGFAPHEQTLVQSGLFYEVQVVKYNTDGFDYRVAIGMNEWWPGPDPVTLRVQYMWSES
jgi:hypothetical protein